MIIIDKWEISHEINLMPQKFWTTGLAHVILYLITV